MRAPKGAELVGQGCGLPNRIRFASCFTLWLSSHCRGLRHLSPLGYRRLRRGGWKEEQATRKFEKHGQTAGRSLVNENERATLSEGTGESAGYEHAAQRDLTI